MRLNDFAAPPTTDLDVTPGTGVPALGSDDDILPLPAPPEVNRLICPHDPAAVRAAAPLQLPWARLALVAGLVAAIVTLALHVALGAAGR